MSDARNWNVEYEDGIPVRMGWQQAVPCKRCGTLTATWCAVETCPFPVCEQCETCTAHRTPA